MCCYLCKSIFTLQLFSFQLFTRAINGLSFTIYGIILLKDYLKNIVDLNNYQVNCYYFNKLVWFYKSFLK